MKESFSIELIDWKNPSDVKRVSLNVMNKEDFGYSYTWIWIIDAKLSVCLLFFF